MCDFEKLSLENSTQKEKKLRKKRVIVSKFGGVCMANPLNITKVIDVIKSDFNRKVIVVSAPGQTKSSDIKITDLLYKCSDSINQYETVNANFQTFLNVDMKNEKNNICDEILFQIEKVFFDILKFFKIEKSSLKNEILNVKKVIKNCKNQKEFRKNIFCKNFKSFIASRGEFLMAKILSEIIDYDFLDASEIIKFNNDNELDFNKTYNLIRVKLNKFDNSLENQKINSKSDKGVIIPGFYGQLPNGQILTFSRGGSDYTASLIAAALNAELYENWKDVNGLMSCDPKIIQTSLNIPEITFHELRQLSYMGSKILHPDTVLPICDKNIPLVIKSIFTPKKSGTKIGNFINLKNVETVKAITVKQNQAHLKIRKVLEYNETEYFRTIFNILNDFKILSVLFDSNIDYINIFINQNNLNFQQQELIKQLTTLNPQSILIEENLSLITIVGEKIIYKNHIFNYMLNELNKNNIEIKFIKIDSLGSNIILAVADNQYKNAIKLIHDLLFLSNKLID